MNVAGQCLGVQNREVAFRKTECSAQVVENKKLKN
jgi:hypothetical protein